MNANVVHATPPRNGFRHIRLNKKLNYSATDLQQRHRITFINQLFDANMSSSKMFRDSEKFPELRMVLVGKTGAGKSATGNTLLGKKAFKSQMCAAGVTSYCEKEMRDFEGQTLAVVDTPGLFDTRMTEDAVKKEIAKCISFAAPGPHVFLLVIEPRRFTKEEQTTVKLIQDMFGEKASAYTMALFTHGDDLEEAEKTIEAFISENSKLYAFIRQCRGGHHVFNNKNKDGEQVRQLVKKIHRMVGRNGGSHYTNEMLEEAEKAIREKMEKLQRENAQLSLEEARRQAERDNSFIICFCRGCLMVAGGVIGSVAGPVGTVAGAKAGAAVGTEIGKFVEAIAGAESMAAAGRIIKDEASRVVEKVNDSCSIQ